MSLAQYNSIVSTLYSSGESIQGIMAKLNDPRVTPEYICNTVMMIYGEAGVAKLKNRVNSTPDKKVTTANATGTGTRAKKPTDNIEKLAKVLAKRSDATLKKMAEIMKSDEAFSKKDRARFTLALIYDYEYRKLWMQSHDIPEQSIIDKLTELGKEKCARPLTKKEIEAYTRISKVYVKALGEEEKAKGKEVTPLYAREVKAKKG